MRATGNHARARKVLERRRDALIDALRTRDGIEVEKYADQVDEIQHASERHLTIQNIDRDTEELRQIKLALAGIREGTFGICVDCEQAIKPNRLAAVPWATRCIQCQEADESLRRGHGASWVGELPLGPKGSRPTSAAL